jgi:amino-acid N-acetyltransferase
MNARGVTLQSAAASYADRIHALVSAHVDTGHLLPRSIDDLTRHADRFVVATQGRRIVGCGELAPLSPRVAEVRSLAVDTSARGAGVGARLVEELESRARRQGFEQLCAFTHAPGYFTRLGFSIVPHTWLLEKVFTDCLQCSRFGRCGQYAMALPLERLRERPARPPAWEPSDGIAVAAPPPA